MGKKEKIELGIIGGIVVFLLLYVVFQKKEISEELQIRRPGFGVKKQILYLTAGEQQNAVSLKVNSRMRTKEEIEQLFDETKAEIRQWLNPTEEQTIRWTESVELPVESAQTGAYLVWDSSDPEILDKKGKLQRGSLSEEAEITLAVQITIGEERQEEQYTILVPSFLPEDVGKQMYLAEKFLMNAEEANRGEDVFMVPREYEGVQIADKPPQKKGMLWLPIVLFLVPVVILLARRQEQEKKRKQRERELLASYPQLVTKLTLYIGAGLSLRSAWERLAAEYRERLKKSDRKEAVYEEILVLAGELKHGTPEAKAYEAFGRRLSLRPYLRCTSLLIGQLEKGAGGLREKLDQEVRLAWDNHRLQAEAKGEEAQTKLLFPMMGMLFLVFAIVMIPAFFQMGM